MKVVFDTNVVLDFLLDRQPHSENAFRLLDYVARAEITGAIAATSFTTIWYILRKSIPPDRRTEYFLKLLALFEIAAVDKTVIVGALGLGFTDFEDAVLHETARMVGADVIVTRDESGFVKGTVRTFQPGSLLALLDKGDVE